MPQEALAGLLLASGHAGVARGFWCLPGAGLFLGQPGTGSSPGWESGPLTGVLTDPLRFPRTTAVSLHRLLLLAQEAAEASARATCFLHPLPR